MSTLYQIVGSKRLTPRKLIKASWSLTDFVIIARPSHMGLAGKRVDGCDMRICNVEQFLAAVEKQHSIGLRYCGNWCWLYANNPRTGYVTGFEVFGQLQNNIVPFLEWLNVNGIEYKSEHDE